MSLTKIIFGLHTTWDDVTIAIGGRPADSATVMTVIKNGSSTAASVPWSSTTETWSIKVEAGDYLFRIDVPGKEEWWNDGLPVTVTDRADATFVFHGPETDAPNAHQTLAWTAASTGTGNDPKDPWPPPAQVATTLPSASFSWHDATLHDARINLLTPKG